MSLFKTTLAVDLSTITKALPPRTHVHSLKFDKDKATIEVIWENEDLHTGLTIPVDFSLEALKMREVPKGTNARGGLAPAMTMEHLVKTQIERMPLPPPVLPPEPPAPPTLMERIEKKHADQVATVSAPPPRRKKALTPEPDKSNPSANALVP